MYSFVFWTRDQNFPRKQMTDVIRQVSCCFSFFCRVVMFTSTFFHISFCLSNVFFSTWAFTPVYHTRRMRVFAFNFKQWFCLSCYLFNCDSITVIGKCFEYLNKMFGSTFLFFTIGYFNQNEWFTLFKKIRWNTKQVRTWTNTWHCLKFWWIISILKFACYYFNLYFKVTGYSFWSMKVSYYSISLVPFWNAGWPMHG